MGTIAVHYPTYGSRIRHTDTIPYEPLEELSTIRVAVRLIPYNNLYVSGRNGRMYRYIPKMSDFGYYPSISGLRSGLNVIEISFECS